MGIDTPQLFSPKGEFIEDVDLSGLDADHVARAEKVRTTQHAVKALEQELADAIALVNVTIAAVSDVEQYMQKHWKKPTFHDLWKQNFGRA